MTWPIDLTLYPVRQLAGQLALEVASGVEHPRLHRVDWTIHDLGDLTVADLLEIGQIHDSAMVWRKLADGAEQCCLRPLLMELLIGAVVGRGTGLGIPVLDRLILSPHGL